MRTPTGLGSCVLSVALLLLSCPCFAEQGKQGAKEPRAVPVGTPPPGLFIPATPAVSSPPPALLGKKDLPANDRPFWRKKPELMQKIREERAVLVSVRQEDVGNKQVRFLMAGAGSVSRSKDFCFKTAQQYSKLKEVSNHFRDVNFDSKTGQLYMVTEALGYQARMILKVTPVSEDWRSELQWEVIWGHFKGMSGIVGFESLDSTHTEVSLISKYQADELPLPRVLMGLALEVITQKVAEKMRHFIEAQP